MTISKICIFITFAILTAVLAGSCTEQNKSSMKETKVKEVDLSQFNDFKPERKMRLLFIHHSVGGQWLAAQGEDIQEIPDTCIYKSHPNGGGLRALLEQNNYEVHEAAYQSAIGAKTDVNDWNAKFRDMMEVILKCDRQDQPYKDSSIKNDIVMFKSCFPNSAIESEGKEPGNPDSVAKTTANYKAAYTKLLGYFRNHPDTLFVCVTAPPLAETSSGNLKEFVKKVVSPGKTMHAMGRRARRFNNWLKDSEHGWLKDYQGRNVVVFDYFDVLTQNGKSDHAEYPSERGIDSHPNSEGNEIAAKTFVPLLNKSVDRFMKK